MPKSKRDKKISLTNTGKKGLALKQRLIEEVRKYVQKYNSVFLISIANTRNTRLLDLRGEWIGSVFFFGKVRIIALGLGNSPETEIADGIHKLANEIRNHTMKGQCGLLFTNKSKKEVMKLTKEYAELEYARAGFVAPHSVELPEGPLPEFEHSIEPYLRLLGMPTALKKGVVTLIKPYRVCQKNDVLTSEQAQILKLLQKPLAVFKMQLLGRYTKKRGFKKLTVSKDTKEYDEEINVEEDNDA